MKSMLYEKLINVVVFSAPSGQLLNMSGYGIDVFLHGTVKVVIGVRSSNPR